MWNTCTCARVCVGGSSEEENPIKARRMCDMMNDSGQFSPSAPRQTLLQIESRYARLLCVWHFLPHTHSLLFSCLCEDLHRRVLSPAPGPNPPADPDLDPVSNTRPVLISPSSTKMCSSDGAAPQGPRWTPPGDHLDPAGG